VEEFMNSVRRIFMRSFAGAVIALALAAAPASAVSSAPARTLACTLEPGVYGITDSTGRLVGILIVYPDCRMEVFTKPEIT
jgi:hypothetical protein